MKNIILIGMPASGKSTLGVLLAKELGMDFVDSDLVLQRRSGKMLFQILKEEGAEGFLAREEETLCSLDLSHTVLATGGSAVYSEKGMAHLKEKGECVYLRVSLAELHRRLGDIQRRGVVLGEGDTLESLFARRTPLYERWADWVLDAKGETLEATAARLISLIQEKEVK